MNKQTRKGFTIIEVVLVLAIAGLIFLMVFVAFPALQRGQRDTAKREDVMRVASQLEQYKANNRGTIPANFTALRNSGFAATYMKQTTNTSDSKNEFVSPNGQNYTFVGAGGINDGNKEHAIEYQVAAYCNGENIVPNASLGNRAYALRVQLEGSGFFCKDSGGSN